MEEKPHGKHKAFFVILIVAVLWLAVFCIDGCAVGIKGRAPIFCMETSKGKGHYVGLGYSYDAYEHPITNEWQYALYVFGKMVKCTFTN